MAFTSIEYPNSAQASGKCWCLIVNRYTDSFKLSNLTTPIQASSASWSQARISPISISVHHCYGLYTEVSGQSLCIHGLDIGSTAHADNICAASNFIHAISTQGNLIK